MRKATETTLQVEVEKKCFVNLCPHEQGNVT